MLALVVALLMTAPKAQAVPGNGAASSAKADAGDQSSAEESLRRAINEYAYGNYGAAIDQLRTQLYPMRLVSDSQVIEARKYLGLSYYLLNRPAEMREELEKLLYLDPDYQLDPFSIPPPIIEEFERIREEAKPQLDVIRLRRAEQSGNVSAVRRIEASVPTTGARGITSFLPFGVGQFENGDSSMGLFFALTEAILLGLNLASYLFATYGVGDDYPAGDHGLVRGLQITQYASLSLFALTWGVGVYHARLQFTPALAPRTQLAPVPSALEVPRYDPSVLARPSGGLLFQLTF